MHFKTLLSLCIALAPLATASALGSDRALRSHGSQRRDQSCVFTDAAAAIKGKESCTAITLQDITVPPGKTLDMTGLQDGTHVTFAGNTSFRYHVWAGPLIAFTGRNLIIDGAPGHIIDGNGPAWWDGLGQKGNLTKPKFFAAHNVVNSIIKGLNVKNTPIHGFSIKNVTNLGLYDITINNSDGNHPGGGHNTDGFDIESSNGVFISGANVINQDDYLAINSGNNITFTNSSCSGGHGLSIGSVGGRKDNTVSNVLISNSQVVDSTNGVRIKTVFNATGSVSGITYSNITLSNISNYGIVIEQDYLNGGPTGNATAGVPITDITIENITGTVESSAIPVYILCADGACSNWSWTGVQITGGTPTDKCRGVPKPASC